MNEWTIQYHGTEQQPECEIQRQLRVTEDKWTVEAGGWDFELSARYCINGGL